MPPETLVQLALAAGLSLPALIAGLAAAQTSGPLACTWPARGRALHRRLMGIRTHRPLGRIRRTAGILLVSSLFATGALAAYAAQPSAPDRLPAEVVGVTGSGDQLGLRVMQDQQARTLKPGDDYRDGWKLDALTPTKATLARDGERREVGLNPTGAAPNAQPFVPPSQVRVMLTDAELLAKVLETGLWDGKTARPGLTTEETARYYVLLRKSSMLRLAAAPPEPAQPVVADGSLRTVRIVPPAEQIDALGPDGPEYAALIRKESAGRVQLAVAAFERYGPVEVPYTQATYREDSAKLAAYPGARWVVRQGGSPAFVMISPPEAAPIQGAAPTPVISPPETPPTQTGLKP